MEPYHEKNYKNEQQKGNKKKKPSVDALCKAYTECKKKKDFFKIAARILLSYLKDVSYIFDEPDSEGFRGTINELIESFTIAKNIENLKASFFQKKAIIVLYINKEKEYIKNKESECKGIINLLTDGISTLNTDNVEFNKRLFGQSRRFEQISYLDNIRLLRAQLAKEIKELKRSIIEKQEQDRQKIELLSNEIKMLKEDLANITELSSKDTLTGAYNRLAYDKYMKGLFKDNTNRKSDTFTMLIIDIDNFKKINDVYGHQVGDMVLIILVNKCKENIRDNDFIARYGGEEFIIVLPGSTLDDGLKKASQICKDIYESKYSTKEMLGHSESNELLSFTVSIGVSALMASDTAETIMYRADKALYKAKNTGKNRAVSELEIE
ncbi:MAG: diguanylate cyclase [Candidatus Magnetoovum sp. WYHC-5]|nr:diguanylate cyclase [Candidatus Magnetoovum sp. WYHC-5]